jgi:predicted GIY-YIG superfamily endonuclease
VAWVYILRCGDNSLYVGHTDDWRFRLRWHRAGFGSRHTSLRLPVELVYKEEHPSTQSAVRRESQIKHWSAKKKAALVRGDFAELKRLSRRRRPKIPA